MKWFLCFGLCALCQVVFGQVTLSDSLKRDKGLRLFLQELHEIAVSRDTVKLALFLDENAEVQPMWMDGVYTSGKQKFMRFWNLGSVKDTAVFWRLLNEVSHMDGMYANPETMDIYYFPKYDPGFEQDAWLVMADSIAVYSEPNPTSKIVCWLPKGTEVASWKYYQYGLPLWFKCPAPYSEREKENGWIQTNEVYVYGWTMSARYRNGKWYLTGVSGFEYLYPK